MAIIRSIIIEQREAIDGARSRLANNVAGIVESLYITPIRETIEKEYKPRTKEPEEVSDLYYAILRGDVIYDDVTNTFAFQKYNNKVLKDINSMNAEYIPWEKAYKIKHENLPSKIQSIIAFKNKEESRRKADILVTITTAILLFNSINTRNISKKATGEIFEIQKKHVEKKKTPLPPNEYAGEMFEGYVNDIDKKIRGFITKDIEELRVRIVKAIQNRTPLKDIKSFIVKRGANVERANRIVASEIKLALVEQEKNLYRSKGITKFKWKHSCPKLPTARPLHVKYHELSNKGVLFDSNNPPEGVMPSELPNCKCYALYVEEEAY